MLMAGVGLISCSSSETSEITVVPYPNHIEVTSGKYDVRNQPVSCDAQADEKTQRLAESFSSQLAMITGGENALTIDPTPAKSGIRFVVDTLQPAEGYALAINRSGIELRASQFNGFLYGVQTLKQLLPVEIFGSKEAAAANWTVPCLNINDAPRFAYRGMHLDVSRHFFSLDEVKRYIDMMVLHKLNALHWHLTDDQGWRIEIKKYPRLTEVGATRKGTVIRKEWGNYDNIPYGGFYTQDEIREIVKYAEENGISVIPEIDLPGHMLAALAAYPQLGCTGGPYEVWGRWGVSDDVLCAGKENSFKFIEDVLTEVMELFPSKYIHIGGDECPKVRWEKCPKCQARIRQLGLKGNGKYSKEHFLQSYVTERVGKFLAAHDRIVIGWDEILEGQAPQDAVIMSWRGSEGGVVAAQNGHDVIMTPNTNFYFDHYQSLDTGAEPFAIGGYLPVEKVYAYNIDFPELNDEQKKHILGVQANLWTEYVKTNEHLEYMLLPRLDALSEVQWTEFENKDYNRFITNFRMHEIYDIMGYNYAKHIFAVTATYTTDTDRRAVMVEFNTQGNAPIHYTLDGSEPTEKSPLYTAPVALTGDCVVKATTIRKNLETPVYSREFKFTKATARKATLNTKPTEKYNYGGVATLTDGYYGKDGYTNGSWVGFLNEPMDVTIDMEGEESYSSVSVLADLCFGEWIFGPKNIQVLTSEDGEQFTEAGSITTDTEQENCRNGVRSYTVEFPATSARYLRVVANPVNLIPAWHGAKGKKAHMFIGEISVE